MTKRILSIAVAGVVALGGVPAAAVSLTVANASFEALPDGGLPLGACGTGCSYSIGAIPGWTASGTTGQFQPGSSSGNFAFFDYVPNGTTVAYTNGGSIVQTVAATAIAGHTYVLTTAFGARHDFGDPGSVTLSVGSAAVLATGTAPAPGSWSTYTATYTATAADAGSAITISLASPGIEGNFDAVTLNDVTAVPEPAAWGLMITGFGLVGLARRRSTTVVA